MTAAARPAGATLERHGAVAPLAGEWDALVDRLGAGPFARPGWIEAWWRAFGRGRLEVLALRRAGELAAVLPLMRVWGALHSTANWHSPEFSVLARDEAAAEELGRAIVAGAPRSLRLSFVNADSAGLESLASAALDARYRLLVRTIERSPHIDLSGGWAAFESSRPRKLWREIRRRERRLESMGGLSIQVVEGPEGLDGALEETFRVEASGWKGQRATAIASSATTRRFYADVARWAAARGALRLAFLRVGNRPIAVDLSLEEGGVHHLLKTGFDPAFAAFGPGKLIRWKMIERAFAIGLTSYELLGSEEPWKAEWSSKQRVRLVFQAFSPGPPGRAEWAAYAFGRPLAKRLLSAMRR
ncbi:MAG: GNAT family N-acetyltransferase [Actinobacteria bacterium]|nr:GNAT family N-acetyltransferase [Actinomycetota bacterium]